MIKDSTSASTSFTMPAFDVTVAAAFTRNGNNNGNDNGNRGGSSSETLPVPPVAGPLPNPFIDLPDNHWAVDEIVYLNNAGIIGGFPDGTFRPEQNVTRAQLAAMIANALKLGTQTREQAQNFSDVPGLHWANNQIQTVTRSGLMIGYNGHFRPEAQITREEMVQVIMRALHYPDDIKGGADTTLTRFTDNQQIPQWARAAVAEAVEAEIVKGLSDNYFGAGTNSTRAQVAVLIYKIYMLRTNQ